MDDSAWNAQIKCKKCGKVFTPITANNVYCSNKCRQYEPVKKEFINKICAYCGNEFKTSSIHKKYCSKECCNLGTHINSTRNRYIIFERDNFRCIYCGKTSYDDRIKLHVDHIYPKKLGGEDRAYNLVTACEECNLGKSANVIKIYKKLLSVVRRRNKAMGISPDAIIKLGKEDLYDE